MKKLLLRALLLVLALLMVIPFAGCQETPKPQETNPVTDPATDPTDTDPAGTAPTETEPAEKIPDLPARNYNNEEFIILTRAQTEHLETLWVKEITDKSSSLHRAIYQRLKNIGYQYGILFDVRIEDPSYVVSTNVKAGQDIFDLVSDHGNKQFSNAMNGYYYDWNDLPYVDLEADWWSREAVREFTTMGGKFFTGFGDIGYMSVGSAGCLFFDRDRIKDVIGLESPYALVDNNQWTFEAFEEYVLTLDSNMDGGDGTGKLETDTFAYVTGNYLGTSHYFHATGARIVSRKNGDWKITVDTDNTNTAAMEMRDLVVHSGAVGFISAFDYSPTRDAFMQGRAAFVSALANDAIFFADSDIRYGILPFPKFTSRVKGYPSIVSAGTSIYTVMRNISAENAERISIVLEEMAYDGYKTIMPLYFDVVLSYQVLQDEDSLRMLHIIRDNLVLDIGAFLGIAGNVIIDAVVSTEGSSIAQLYGEIESTAQEKLAAWRDLDVALGVSEGS
ncbi:MAG: hypothetical protein IIW36_00165 [Clostridia bacterium]|nr:hypothetical protein [Clostridia bacterium]